MDTTLEFLKAKLKMSEEDECGKGVIADYKREIRAHESIMKLVYTTELKMDKAEVAERTLMAKLAQARIDVMGAKR
eukprot:5520549-Pleurochrysis_carterae.AAC.1